MNPWKRARLEHTRAETNYRALNGAVAEVQRMKAERDATARLLVQAEDVIRQLQHQARDRDVTRLTVELVLAKDIRKALEKRLADAQRAQEICDRDHAPLVRAWQQRAALEDPWADVADGWAGDE